jgi:hypothetical protein
MKELYTPMYLHFTFRHEQYNDTHFSVDRYCHKAIARYCDMMAETRILDPEGTAYDRERPINAFPRRQIRGAAIAELLETVIFTGSATRLYS